MAQIKSEAAYRAALKRINELLPMVDDNTPANNRNFWRVCQTEVNPEKFLSNSRGSLHT